MMTAILAASFTSVSKGKGSGRYVHEIEGGLKLQGVKSGRVAIFKGIPYARAERWKEPQPVDLSAFTGELDLTKNPVQCVQSEVPVEHAQGETCLNLVVYMPLDISTGALPCLLVWHPGNFVSGGNGDPRMEFSKLAAKHRILVVVPNYRLGVAGFMPDTSRASGLTNGNWGMLDLIESGRWCRRHVHLFGGSPHQLTLLGHSAGALMAHLVTLQAQPETVTWQHLWLASGSAQLKPPRSLALALHETKRLQQLAKTTSLDSIPMIDLTRLAHENGFDGIYAPCIDAVTVKQDPNLMQGNTKQVTMQVPTVFTWLEEEGQSFIPFELTGKTYPSSIEYLFALNNPSIIRCYPINGREVPAALAHIITDKLFVYPAYHHARLLRDNGSQVGMLRLKAKDVGMQSHHGADLSCLSSGDLPAPLLQFITSGQMGALLWTGQMTCLSEAQFKLWSTLPWEKMELVNAHLRLPPKDHCDKMDVDSDSQ